MEHKDFTYRILVADDDAGIRDTSESILSVKGYEVRTASDGFEALALMQRALPDLIVSDLEMPNMSGFEFLSVVRRRFPQIPIIAVTGRFVPLNARNSVLCDEFLEKGNYPIAELLERIASLLGRSPIRPQPAKPDLAPVWIPRNGDYYVVTCTHCLRSFSLPTEIEPGGGQRECLHCGELLRYILEPL